MEQENYFLKIVKAGLILSFFTPLVLAPIGITLSAYPKAVFFRTVIEITFIFYLALLYFTPLERNSLTGLNLKYLPKISPLLFAVIIFNAILILSSIFGLNPKRSFIGTLDRAEGVILHIHFLAFLIMIIGVFKSKKEWLWLLKLAFIVSVLSSFAGILQKIGLFSFYGNSLPTRISGTLANPDFFGAYMSLSIFLGLLVFILEKERDFKFLWLGLIFLNIFTLVLSHTRGAWFGLIFGLFLFFILFSTKYSGLDFRKRKIILAGLFIFLILGLFITINRQKLGLERYYLTKRFFSVLNIKLGASSRLDIWEIAAKSWRERPILGWGPEIFGYLFDKNFKSKYIHTGELYYDYPHNKYLGILSDSGVIGLFSYLAIFAAAFYLIFHPVKYRSAVIPPKAELFNRVKNRNKIIFGKKYPSPSFIIAAFFIAYLIQNIFAFDTIAIYFLLFLILGFVNNNFFNNTSNLLSSNNSKNKYIILPIIIFFILISLIVLYQINIKPTLASYNYVKALKIGASPESFEEVLANLKKSVSRNTLYDRDFKMETAKTLIFYLETNRANGFQKETFDLLWSLKWSFEERIKTPEIRTITAFELLAKTYQVNYLIYGNKDALFYMESVLKAAMDFNNQHSRLHRLMGETKILQNNYKEGEDYYNAAFEMGPKGINNKIKVYKDLGRAYLLAKDVKKQAESFKKAIDMQFETAKHDSAILALDFDSKDNQAEAMLWERTALIFYKDLKDKETAFGIYQKAIQTFPQYKQTLQSHLEILRKEELEQ